MDNEEKPPKLSSGPLILVLAAVIVAVFVIEWLIELVWK
jgi:hypothetical protein